MVEVRHAAATSDFPILTTTDHNSSLFFFQILVGEEEPEDIAVRKFMKSVQDSRVIEQVR
jgi:hypothetical protein